MDKILERAIDKLEAKAEKDEKLLWEVYHKLKDRGKAMTTTYIWHEKRY